MEADGATIHKGDVWSLSTLPDIRISDPNLIGWWKLDDEGTGIATDYSGHDNHGKLFGNLQWVAGFDGEGLEFNGAGNVDLLTGLISTDISSVTFWIKILQTENGYIFYCSEGTSGTAKYSEASRAISGSKGWTREGVTELSMWFTGYPAYVGTTFFPGLAQMEPVVINSLQALFVCAGICH